MRPEVLIIMSDQHAAGCAGYRGDGIVSTPNLDRLAAGGAVFENAYTSCPLCVPARMSFMTGVSASRGGWFDNDFSMGDNRATFMHSLAVAGYETVLCGRMHFIGADQAHGFTKRIMGDFTVGLAGKHADRRKSHGAYELASVGKYCLRYVGANDITPVIEYDGAVFDAALDYLNGDYEKPQCLLVGTFGPHFPFVSLKEDFAKYRNLAGLPGGEAVNFETHPLYRKYEKALAGEGLVKDARAAYYGLVENLDRRIGVLLSSWENYLKRSGRRGVVVYLSDHGESLGVKNLFGKMNLFDPSAKIPLVFSGAGVKEGVRIKQPVSIMDIGPTLCAVCGAELPANMDGVPLGIQLNRGLEDAFRGVIADYLETDGSGRLVPGRMLRFKNWKLIRYKGYEEYDLLFDLDADPQETVNRKDERAKEYQTLARMLETNWDTERICLDFTEYQSNINIIMKWNKATGQKDGAVWQISERAAAPISVLSGRD